jgi:hypothetical protein
MNGEKIGMKDKRDHKEINAMDDSLWNMYMNLNTKKATRSKEVEE